MTVVTNPDVSSPAPLTVHLALPKGRMQDGVMALLSDAGIRLSATARGYRPSINLGNFETKILKPQNIVEMLDAGTRDLGFAGADWVAELDARVVEVLDTGLDRVRVVAAAPPSALDSSSGRLRADRPLVIASEYERIARRWIEQRGGRDRFVRSYGATEVFPPEDADCIVDVTASGATLEANALVIVEELMTSSTRLYASRRAWDDAAKRSAIDDLAMVLRSVLEARKRVMLELNVASDRLREVVQVLPCMRCPTISSLAENGLYAVKAAVPRDVLPRLIPRLKSLGGSDIIITPLGQVVP
jgi:ATP phosphoribosyltransferase